MDPSLQEGESTVDTMSEANAPAVPVVRLDISEEEASRIVREACTRYGFFYLEGHGVSEDYLDEHLRQCRRFFELPLEAKLSCLLNEDHRGYTPLCSETLDPEHQSKGDTKEGYYIGKEMKENSGKEHLPLHGANVWPEEKLLPGWKGHMLSYSKTMHCLASKILRLLSLALDLPPHYFDDKFSDPLMMLRLLHYDATESEPSEGVLGAGAHTDYGMMTLLLTDSQPGLQVLVKDSWIDVPPRAGALVVNLGDMLERWTNGRFRSALHRVVNQSGRERFSSPFFFEPNFETLVACLPSCCKDEPAKYPPVIMGEHLLSKYAKTYKSGGAQS